jgi:uncharacterized protein (TIGR03086 family)
MHTADRYRRLAARFTELVKAVPADRWESATPCEGWTARDVLDHVVTTEFDVLGRMPFAPAASATAAAWPTVRDQIQAALDDPAKADYGYDGYFGPTTFAQTIDAFYNADLVVHTWDLATATDLTEFISIDPVEMEKVIADLAPMSEMMRQPGLFGPARDVADDADAQTRFLAFFGRAS